MRPLARPGLPAQRPDDAGDGRPRVQPSPASSAEPPDTVHPSGPTTIADYPRLVANLKRAFDKTAQPGGTLPIVYDGYGVQSAAPAAKAALYSGAETDAVPEATQGAFYAQALQLVVVPAERDRAPLRARPRRAATSAGRQTGLYYVDGTPKTDFSAVRAAIAAAQSGGLPACPGAAPRTAEPPTVAPAADGRSAEIGCSGDCSYVVALERNGVPVRARSGSATAGTTVTASLPPAGLAPGDRLVVHVASRLDPGDEVVAEGEPVGVG